MPEMRLWVRQFRGTKFSILSIVLIYVTPWIAILMSNKFLCQSLKFWIATTYPQCDIFSTKSHSGFRWPALCKAADDLVVWVYAHCTKSVVISSVSVAHLGCSQRHGKRKKEWMARGEMLMIGSEYWGYCKKLSSTIKTNTVSPVARPQVQTWFIWYRSQHNGTVFCIATTPGFMHLFLRRWCQWKSYQTLIDKVCGLETIFAWLLVWRYMYQQTHGTGAPLHL